MELLRIIHYFHYFDKNIVQGGYKPKLAVHKSWKWISRIEMSPNRTISYLVIGQYRPIIHLSSLVMKCFGYLYLLIRIKI